MINQELAKQILNVLLTTSEGNSFSGDASDYQQAINDPYNADTANWKIAQKNLEVSFKTRTTFPFNTSTDKDTPVAIDFKKDILPLLKEGKTEEEQETLNLLYSTQAKLALYEYIRANLQDDEIDTEEDKDEEFFIASPKTIITATAEGKAAPYYPIGIPAESIQAMVNKFKEIRWATKEANFPLWNGVSSKLDKAFESYKKNVLLNTTYYKTSSTNTVLEEKEDAYGNKSTQEKVITFPEIKYTRYFLETKTYYFKLTWPKEKKNQYGQVVTTGTDTEVFRHTQRLWSSTEETLPELKYKLTYCSQFASASGTSFYPDKAYIGLFTNLSQEGETDKTVDGMPRIDGTGFREPPWKNLSDTNPQTYQRMNLHRGLFTDSSVFNEVIKTPEDNKYYGDYKGYAYLNNQEIIMFPEILDENGWGTISGFGLFENEEPTEGEIPFFWGTVTPVPGDRERVPLFRPEEFQIYLG